MEQFIESWWLYIVLVVVGFLFRTALYNPFETNSEMHRKNLIIQIGIIIVITLCVSGISNNTISKNFGAGFLLLVGYCFYVLTKRVGPKGYTESLLVLIDGYMVTALSFMSFPGNIIMIAVTIILSILAYKYWFNEKKYDLCSIVLSCVEALALSTYVWWKNKNGILDTILIVVFVETFIFMVNCFAKLFFVKVCGGNEDEYWLMLKGIDVDSY